MTMDVMDRPAALNGEAAPSARANVFLAAPYYGCPEMESLAGLLLASSNGKHNYEVRPNPASLLAHNFNRLFCDFWNGRDEFGYTHFAMMHSDQSPPANWIDTMLEEMDRVGADVLSVVLAIKDNRRLTSTAVRSPEGGIRRLTLHELYNGDIPETFSAPDVCKPDQQLMVNTGLWVWKRNDEVMSRFPGFTISDAIVDCPDGKKRARVLPEDWNFSIWAAEQGLKVFATTKLYVVHYGRAGWGNSRADAAGGWKTDKGDVPEQEQASCPTP